MRIAILGAGPAGALAALDCHKRGHQVRVVERSKSACVARPQGAHVHRIAAATWDAMSSYAPELEGHLADAGAPVCGDEALGGPRSRPIPRPSRPLLDAALLTSLNTRGISVHRSPKPAIRWSGTRWWVDRWQADLVIDATGAQRTSLPEVARIQARAVPLQQGPMGPKYRSAAVSGVQLPAGLLGWSRKHASGVGSFLWPTESGLLLTQLLPANLETASLSPELDEASLGGWTLAGARAPQRIESEACDIPPGLVWIGDALVQTPPSLGRGLESVCRSVALLDRPNTFAALQTLSRQMWSQALVQTALSGLVLVK